MYVRPADSGCVPLSVATTFVIIVGVGTRAALGCSKVCFSTVIRPPDCAATMENSLNNQSRAAPMPRFGSFCTDNVLRVPNHTSLRIVFSMLRASISLTSRTISLCCVGFLERPRACERPGSVTAAGICAVADEADTTTREVTAIDSATQRVVAIRRRSVSIEFVVEVLAAGIRTFPVSAAKGARGVFRNARHRFKTRRKLLTWARNLRRHLHRWAQLMRWLINFPIHLQNL